MQVTWDFIILWLNYLFVNSFGWVIASNSRLTKTGRSWFIPVFLIFALRTFAYEPFQIPSGSMLPGLKVGDFLLVNKHVYGLQD